MKIVSNKELLDRAKAGHYAVAAFNTNNLEYIQAVLKAAAELNAPVIIEAAKFEIDYMNGFTFVAMVRTLSEHLNIPIGIHLDHGSSFDEAIRCINYGFKSVMYDGSALPLEENILNTQRIVKAAHACGVSVEGEIGFIGQAEDDAEDPKTSSDMIGLADPFECEKFVKETGVDCFAAANGNVHGIYKREPELRFNLLKEIARLTNVPLVLHGGTGLSIEDIREAISLGVSKINFSTVMRKGCVETLLETLQKNPRELDLTKIFAPCKEKMVEIAKYHIEMCMSDGKAW